MSEPEYTVEFTCEAAPVQAEGKIAGRFFYFRARWDGWRFGIGETIDEAVDATMMLAPTRFVRGGEWPGASYMPLAEAEHLIAQCIREYMQAPASGST